MKKQYVKAVGSSLTARIINVVATFATIWLLNEFYSKGEFGLFMLSFTIVTVLGLVISSPFSSLILYRIPRIEADFLLARTLGFTLFVAATASVTLVAVALFAAADPLSSLFNKPELAGFLGAMAILLALDGPRHVLGAWFRANETIFLCNLVDEIIPQSLRVIFLFLLLLFGLPREWIIPAFAFSLVVPVLLGMVWARWDARTGFNTLTRWDIEYGAKNLFTQMITKGGRFIDIFLVGALMPATAVAYYAVAQKFASLLVLGKNSLAMLLLPRLGKLMSKGDRDGIALEYGAARQAAFLFTLFGAAFLFAFGPWILEHFQGYEGAFTIIVILIIAQSIDSGFGFPGGYLAMAGYAGWNLVASSFFIAFTALLSFVLIPLLGAEGAALTIGGGLFFMFCITHEIIRRKDGFVLLNAPSALALLAVSTICALWAWQDINPLAGGLAVFAVALFYLIADRSLIKFWKRYSH
ncbi:MAG: lipopolysaccharide biosynthesis protein [Spartobacteria bacterium]|nr:lipopolysaccharide biosynthesis protein [Spartobacteria bacterium]